MKHSQTRFRCLYVKVATIQIWGQTNTFPMTCSFQKGPQRLFKCSRLEVTKNYTTHFVSKFLVYSSLKSKPVLWGTVHYLWGWPGRIKSDRVMKNFGPETTGYEYFKKQNDRVLKKNSFNDNKVLILLTFLVLQLPISNKLFNIINIFITNRTFQTLQNANSQNKNDVCLLSWLSNLTQ